MKKLTLIISALALVLGMSQCKKPYVPDYNGAAGERIVQEVTLNTSNNNNGGNSKVGLWTLTSELKLKWNNGDVIYVYDGTSMCGILNFVDYVGEDLSQATFNGKITPLSGSKLRFYHFNGVSASDVPGFEGNSLTLVRDYDEQDADNVTDIIPGFVLVSEPTDIVSDGNYNVEMKLPFSVVKVQFDKFGDGASDITVKNVVSTGFSVDKTGTMTMNEKTSMKLREPGVKKDFYAVFMPKEATTYRFSNASGIADVEWDAIDKGYYYTVDGGTPGATGNAILIEATQTPAVNDPIVATTSGCNGCVFSFGGNVTSSPAQYCEFGVVYMTKNGVEQPEIGKEGCTKIECNTALVNGSVAFNVNIPGLTIGTEYAFQAYAIGEKEITIYGGTRTFTYNEEEVPQKLPDNWVGSASPLEFTVGPGANAESTDDDVKVRFSCGNLQWTSVGTHATAEGTGEGTWRFADHQFDVIVDGNTNISSTYIGWIDLLGWATSGYNGSNPYNINPPCGPNTGEGSGDLSGTNYDWGVYNDICNDGPSDGVGVWRTLKTEEWKYLINSRPNAASLYGEGKVGSCTYGVIILPDNWVKPDGVNDFVPGRSNWNSTDPTVTNIYNYAEWSKMEAAGAVILPNGAGRSEKTVGPYNYYDCNYWSISYYYGGANYLLGQSNNVSPENYGSSRSVGHNVRLVRNVE